MNGLKLFSLAWRNLWRQKRRTILTLISIAFGGFLAVLMTAMQDQSFADFIDNAAKLGSGHVTIQHPEYRDRPTLNRTVTGTDAKRAVANDDPDVVKAVDRASGQAMLSTASDSYGAFFIAYDPELEDENTMEFTEGLVEGELFETSDDDGIILGKVLAQNLDAQLGDKIVYTLTDRNGEIVNGMERVSGIVSTGAASTDAGLVLLPLDSVRSVIGYDPNESTQVAIFLGQGRRSLIAADRLDAKVGDDAAVLTWDEIQPEIKAFVAMKVGGGRVMEIIIGVLVAAGIFNTIFMSVMERTREFGINFQALDHGIHVTDLYREMAADRRIQPEPVFLGKIRVRLDQMQACRLSIAAGIVEQGQPVGRHRDVSRRFGQNPFALGHAKD